MNLEVLESRSWSHSIGGRDVLDRVDLRLPAGRITALLGPNGAGKSTLLCGALGLLSRPGHRGGTLRVLGRDPYRHGARVRSAVGHVPDRLDVPAWMRVRDHLRFLRAFRKTWDDELSSELHERFGVSRNLRVAELSKGQRAAHAVACALAHRPALLLCDEPFDGLDPVARRAVFDALLEFYGEGERTILFSTQSMRDVERLADHVVVMDAGRILSAEPMEALCARNARVRVELERELSDWIPPGNPRTIGSGSRRELVYTDFDEGIRSLLQHDPAVRRFEGEPHDLEDAFVAMLERSSR